MNRQSSVSVGVAVHALGHLLVMQIHQLRNVLAARLITLLCSGFRVQCSTKRVSSEFQRVCQNLVFLEVTDLVQLGDVHPS